VKVGILCEFSGRVRDAFLALGHDAVSCDLLPTDSPGPHRQGDCLEQDWSGFDLLICHPPCKYLSRAGVSWLNRQPNRATLRIQAMEFFLRLYHLPVDRVCVENPIGFPHQAFRLPDQTIEPYHFGDPHRKRTCLWLRNLPPLIVGPDLFVPTSRMPVKRPAALLVDAGGKPRHFTDMQPSESKRRSITFPGIAQAMAEQWGSLAADREVTAHG
jgi:hypothetical protein